MPKRGGENLQIKKRANLRSLSSSFASSLIGNSQELKPDKVGEIYDSSDILTHILKLDLLTKNCSLIA